MAKQSRGSKTPAKKQAAVKSRNETTRTIENLIIDEHLFVPHLKQLDLKASFESTGDTDVYGDILESICGVRDDSQAVEQYNGTLGVTTAFVAAHQSAVCQVQWNNNLASVYSNAGNVSGVRWGTGTMIANDIMLTCGHLFDQTGGGWQRPRVNGTTNIISPQEIARNMRVNFNFQVDPAGNLRTEQSFPILDLIEYRLGGIDMAICRIGGNPGATFGRTQISSTDAATSDVICIIGHPAGQPKRVEAGPTTRIDGNLIRYNDIDTLGGNSGSGILRASDGRLVGIHTNGGCTAASPGDGGSNFGQRIAAVIAVSPTLQRLLRPKAIRDDIATLKFRDDGGTKLKILDDPSKLKFRDDIATLKFRDDVKQPFYDKRPVTDSKIPGLDNKGFDDPFRQGGFRREGQSVRPFILSTPHHSNAWQTGAPQGISAQEEMGALLMQYEQAIEAYEEELRQLENDYRELYAQYESMIYGGQQI